MFPYELQDLTEAVGILAIDNASALRRLEGAWLAPSE